LEDIGIEKRNGCRKLAEKIIPMKNLIVIDEVSCPRLESNQHILANGRF
jgi:hypothetical protein